MDEPSQPPDDWEASEVRQLYDRFMWSLQRHRKRVWIAAGILFVLGWLTFLLADQRAGEGVLVLAILVLVIGLPATAPNADLNTQAGVQDGLSNSPHGPAL
jgi:hypothetical protein